MAKPQSEKVLLTLDQLLPQLEPLYKDIHAHPELSMQEVRTSKLAAEHLRAAGYQVTDGVGKTGVVGVLRNGDGPTLMLRADMDALPVKEATGLPYASTATATDREGPRTTWGTGCLHRPQVPPYQTVRRPPKPTEYFRSGNRHAPSRMRARNR